jgi:hypothetical protein
LLARLGDGDTGAVGGVNALPYIDGGRSVIGVGVPLAPERLEMALSAAGLRVRLGGPKGSLAISCAPVWEPWDRCT